jgi:hypothetical protein
MFMLLRTTNGKWARQWIVSEPSSFMEDLCCCSDRLTCD